MVATLILASASPRRRALLEEAGFRFEILPADVDENPKSGESPQVCVNRLAREKAEQVARSRPGAWVLGADTLVIADPGGERETILSKPNDPGEAARMLALLSGVRHEVVTAVALVRLSEAGLECDTFSSKAEVFFRELASSEIEVYVASGEPMDKAGAYAIQGGAARFIERYEGSWSAIVGLPMEETIRALQARGITPT